MGAERARLIEAYWRTTSACAPTTSPPGSVPSRSARETTVEDVDDGALEVVDEATQSWSAVDVIDLLEDLLSADGADAVYVGAGPLEDLLHERPEVSSVIAERCCRSDLAVRWHSALSTVIWDERHVEPLSPLAPWLPLP